LTFFRLSPAIMFEKSGVTLLRLTFFSTQPSYMFEKSGVTLLRLTFFFDSAQLYVSKKWRYVVTFDFFSIQPHYRGSPYNGTYLRDPHYSLEIITWFNCCEVVIKMYNILEIPTNY